MLTFVYVGADCTVELASVVGQGCGGSFVGFVEVGSLQFVVGWNLQQLTEGIVAGNCKIKLGLTCPQFDLDFTELVCGTQGLHEMAYALPRIQTSEKERPSRGEKGITQGREEEGV